MVRDYKVSDLERVISVFHLSVREVASRDYSPAQIAAWTPQPADLNEWSRRLDSGGVFIDERRNKMSGFTRVDDSGYVDLLYVHPAFQRQGVARALLERVISWAVSQKVPRLTAEVSITARPFFEKIGFHVVKAQEVERRGVLFQNFKMERDIDRERDRHKGRLATRVSD